ncbi:MAG: hypothetical protein H6933_05280 [Burkholderiaceae bacterium]|nr:hypothetical protein [Burkholderiaceae bacterium]
MSAAPVPADALAPDPQEEAVRWTLDGLAALASWAVEPAATTEGDVRPAVALQSQAASPAASDRHVRLAPADVPDPGGYALMGLLLLGTAAAVRALARRTPVQRGLSKNT